MKKGNSMKTEAPSHLTCPFCPSQGFPTPIQTRRGLVRYQCPAKHQFFIIEQDTSFNFGHNKEEEKENV